MTDPLRAPDAAEIEERDEARARIDTAVYIAELTANLAGMARKRGLDALGFILEMAQLEAENATRHVEGRH